MLYKKPDWTSRMIRQNELLWQACYQHHRQMISSMWALAYLHCLTGHTHTMYKQRQRKERLIITYCRLSIHTACAHQATFSTQWQGPSWLLSAGPNYYYRLVNGHQHDWITWETACAVILALGSSGTCHATHAADDSIWKLNWTTIHWSFSA